MFQILQRQVDYGGGVGIVRHRMAESASGFHSGADESEIDQVITRRDAWKQ